MQGKPRLHVSVNLLFGGWPPSWRLHRRRRRRRRRRAYAPTRNIANHDNHEKINSWVSFSFLYGYGARLEAVRAAGAPLLPLSTKILDRDWFSTRLFVA